ncbi:tetratricopeptide repeat protein [Adonisia turfae]|uniref:Tetratricopeptide repeat protein n=1 Tax=Adonisia turfae CCMR0081 TaxID=2292702 RepID=A0A6M0RF19_9CYAN|nr:tetratricopeptide repeat protein [Adonisia turfae]NEZ54453.1 tetratricopeptide repeat protein [Adonisia turfae CCMR0081]
MVQNSLSDYDVTAAGQELFPQIKRLLLKDGKRPSAKRRSHVTAIRNWLCHYAAPREAPNLERIRGYLEAFFHLCEIDQWQESANLLLLQLYPDRDDNLSSQLDVWGYYQEQLKLFQQLLGKLEQSREVWILRGVGNALSSLGNYQQAIGVYEQSLQMAQVCEDMYGQACALGNLGNACEALGNYNDAIDRHNESLQIFQEISEPEEEAKALGNLGIAYDSLGEYTTALDYLEKQLELSEKINDVRQQSTALGSLGNVYQVLGDYQKCIELQE